MRIGIEIPEELVYMIDKQARSDGHDNRSAVIQKALVFFFAEEVAFVANKSDEKKLTGEKQCKMRINKVPGEIKIAEVNRFQNIAKLSESFSGGK